MGKLVRAGAIVLALLCLQACQSVNTQVSRFHSLPPDLAGRTFIVVPDPTQDGKQEFNLYGRDIAGHLARTGLVETQVFAQAEFVVMLSYNIGNGQTVTSQVPLWGQTGGGTSYTTGTVSNPYSVGSTNFSATTTTAPTYGYVGSTSVTETVYTRHLEIALIDRAKTTNPNERLVYAFEGKAISSGSNATFHAVSLCLINAIMDDFPGASGRTKTVQALSEKCVR